MVKNHGVEYTASSKKLRNKMSETLLETTGYKHQSYNPKTQKATRKTFMENWGVTHPMKLRSYFEAQQKSGFRTRDFTSQGMEFRVRGYEKEAIKMLVKSGVPARYILTTASDGVPTIKYKFKGVEHSYHPDMYVKYKNRWTIFEVKSTYTLGVLRHEKSKTKWYRNKVKFLTTAQKYKLRLIVVTEEGSIIVDSPHTHTLTSMRLLLKTTLNPRQL